MYISIYIYINIMNTYMKNVLIINGRNNSHHFSRQGASTSSCLRSCRRILPQCSAECPAPSEFITTRLLGEQKTPISRKVYGCI